MEERRKIDEMMIVPREQIEEVGAKVSLANWHVLPLLSLEVQISTTFIIVLKINKLKRLICQLYL